MGILVLSLHLIRKKSSFYPVKRGYRFKELRRMLSLGVSSLISEITTGIVMIVFNIIILRLAGNAGVAAYGVLANIILVVIAVYNGIAQGSQPLFGRFFASHDTEKLHLTYRDALIAVGLASAVFYVATMASPHRLRRSLITRTMRRCSSSPWRGSAFTLQVVFFSGLTC